MESDVINYILAAKKAGLSEAQIKQNLLAEGWDAKTVEDSFAHSRSAEESKGSMPLKPQNAQFISAAHISPTGQLHATPVEEPLNFMTANPAAAVEQPQPEAAVLPKKSNKKLFIISAAVIVVLGIVGFVYYAYGFNLPSQVWKKFTTVGKDSIYQTNFSFTYSDPNTVSSSTAAGTGDLSMFENIKVQFSGNAYLNASNPQSPQSSSDIQYSFGSGATSFGTGFSYRLVDNKLYFDLSNNPLLKAITSEYGSNAEWLMVDLSSLQSQASSTGDQSQAALAKELTDPSFKQELQTIWDNSTIIKEDKFLGFEKVNGVETMHFQNSVDKTALNNLLGQYIDAFSAQVKKAGEPVDDSGLATAKQVIAALINKEQVKQLETWIGIRDFKLYKVVFVSNAPSVASFIDNASSLDSLVGGELGADSAKDATRVADARQMSSALQLYFDDYKGYPDGNNGQPVGVVPTYIGEWPVAPAANGGCSDYYNSFWYTPEGTKTITNGKTVYSSYQITFCLGAASGGYKAGLAKLTPSGIADGLPCTDTANCVASNPTATSSPDQQMEQQIEAFVNKLDFTAEIDVTEQFSNYGKTQTVLAPDNYFDILNALDGAQAKERDSKRIGDVQQIATALELYFNANHSYPLTLNALTPTYMASIPIAPTPQDGSCSVTQNNYTYVQEKGGTDYVLGFCLGGATGTYQAGVRNLTDGVIK